MIRILGTLFAGLLGLAFGSFLNVCLSRWPAGESIVHPRSHCRNCDHTLAWWENIPLCRWLFLRGRCRKCHTTISWRYPLVELTVGALWAQCAAQFVQSALLDASPTALTSASLKLAGFALFNWLLVGLAVLDAEHLWLPDAVTLPGIVLGGVFWVLRGRFKFPASQNPDSVLKLLGGFSLAVVLAAALILIIRWTYWLIRRREGIGLGDAKLMALLAAWLGVPGALVAFALGITLGAAVSLALLALPSRPGSASAWALKKLPLGTFLCIGGIVSSLWGTPLIAAYLRWAGF
jgi:leader peptidase (prepilin peptidase)/N-methyltransferase